MPARTSELLVPLRPEGVIARWRPPRVGNEEAYTIVHDGGVRYCLLEHIKLRNTQAVILDAFMGSGKTVCSTSWINELPDTARVLVISARQSYARAACQEFNRRCNGKFECYLSTERKLIDCPRLFIQFESLHKIKSGQFLEGFDVVIVDELESVMTQAVCQKTNKDAITQNQAVFLELLSCAGKVMMMDAFMTNRVTRLLNHLHMDYTYHEYKRLPVLRKAIRYHTVERGQAYKALDKKRDLDRFMGVLLERLEKGERVFMITTAKDKLEQFVKVVKQALPHKIVRAYHSDSTESLENVAVDWKVDLVIATGVLTVGVDFNEKWFHNVFIYASAASQNQGRDVFQGHMRVRQLINNELHFFVDPTQYKECEPYMTREQIDVKEWAKIERQREIYGCVGRTKFMETNDFWYQIHLDSLVERNHSNCRLLDMFDYYLEKCNYEVSEARVDDDIEELIEEISGKVDHAYESIPNLNYPDMVRLKLQETSRDRTVARLTDLERGSLRKWSFDCTIPFALPEHRRAVLWSIYQKLGHPVWNNLRIELGLATGQLTWADIRAEGGNSMWNDGTEQRLVTMENIIRMFDLTNTVEEQRLTRSEVQERMKLPDYLELECYGRAAFGLRDQGDDDKPIHKKVTLKRTKQFLEACFKKWSGSTLISDKRERTQVNGKRITTSGLTLKPVDMSLITDVLPRGVKQIEKNRANTFRMLNDEKLRKDELARLERKVKFELDQTMKREQAAVKVMAKKVVAMILESARVLV